MDSEEVNSQTRAVSGAESAAVEDVDHGASQSRRNPVVAALLLSGGASRRMGQDKARLAYEGSTLARRTGGLLELVVDIALEIGPGHSGLVALEEEPRGQGPLAAIVAGRRALLERGHDGSALIVACDMPLLSEDLLRFLVGFDTTSSVVPVVEGRVQPLCAKWGAGDLDAAKNHYSRGERSLRFLATAPGVILLAESQWSAHASRATFTDVDTPDEARRLGLVF